MSLRQVFFGLGQKGSPTKWKHDEQRWGSKRVFIKDSEMHAFKPKTKIDEDKFCEKTTRRPVTLCKATFYAPKD